MSTITKIGGPKVRESRAMRKRLLRDARAVRDRHGGLPSIEVAARVERWHDDPNLTGEEKNALCTELARGLTAK